MFGRNKVSKEEFEKLKQTIQMDEDFFAEVQEKQAMFDATNGENTESRRQAAKDVEQISQNISGVVELASGNVETEARLTEALRRLLEKAGQMEQEENQVRASFRGVLEETTSLVDANKHFTSPSKYLNEVPGKLRNREEKLKKYLEQMEEYNKQMGVLALDAAIEAGRLGEGSKQFVASAEAVRSYAANYDEVIGQVKQQLEDAKEETARLEEEIHRLVKLLKENNIATTRLMKSCQKAVKQADVAGEASLQPDIPAIANLVIELKNADDEIVKAEERNRMQLEDLQGEFEAQEKNQKETAQLVDPFFRHVVERKAGREE